MPVTSAGGRLGARQIERIRARLVELGQRGLFRVLLIHHPPFGDPKHRRKELEDFRELRTAIADAGVELVLHGHTHRSSLNAIPVPTGSAPVIGVASASARAWRGKDPARYHIYSIEAARAGWRVGVEIRSLNSARTGIETTSAFELALPMPASDMAAALDRAAA
jgi:3',5'-cyclic AMP phosphodiesterase CpdA